MVSWLIEIQIIGKFNHVDLLTVIPKYPYFVKDGDVVVVDNLPRKKDERAQWACEMIGFKIIILLSSSSVMNSLEMAVFQFKAETR